MKIFGWTRVKVPVEETENTEILGEDGKPIENEEPKKERKKIPWKKIGLTALGIGAGVVGTAKIIHAIATGQDPEDIDLGFPMASDESETEESTNEEGGEVESTEATED